MKIMLTNSNKVQELENQIDRQAKDNHDLKHRLSELEAKLQKYKQDGLLQSSKLEDMKMSEIELQEKLKASLDKLAHVQETYKEKVENLTTSQKETESKWKECWAKTSKELDKEREKTRGLEIQITELQGVKNENELYKAKIAELEGTVSEKSKLAQHQK